MSKPDVFGLVFVITAVAFNLLIAGIFIADKKQYPRLIRTLGMTWLAQTHGRIGQSNEIRQM